MDSQASKVKIFKPKLIAKLKELISDAKSTPIEELCKTGNYENSPDFKYPQTKGERIVVEALDLLLNQDWVDDDPILDDMTSVLGQLDTGVDKPWAWQELFQLIREVK